MFIRIYNKRSKKKTIDNSKQQKQDITNFPKQGDDEKISLRNSKYRPFDVDYAEDLKKNWPQIWKKGGNIEGNNQYRRLLPIIKRKDKSAQTKTEEIAIRLRDRVESYIKGKLGRYDQCRGSVHFDSEHSCYYIKVVTRIKNKSQTNLKLQK